MKPAMRMLAGCAVLLLCVAAAQAKPNFSGEWKLNVSKSDFGQMPAPTSMTQKITHNDPELKIAVSQVSERGEMNYEAAYTTDGKECINQRGNFEVKSVLKWDGDTLTVTSKMDFQGNPVTISDKWTLSEDGKTLTINRHFSSSMGEGDAKTVLEKQ